MKAILLVEESFDRNIHEAVKLMNKAIELDLKDPIAKKGLANWKVLLGEKEEAIKLFEDLSHLHSMSSEKLGLVMNAEKLKNELWIQNHPIYGETS